MNDDHLDDINGAAEYNQFTADFKNESDRAAVIVGAAKLDLLLYQIIERYLLPSTGSRDELLDAEGALGSFSSRINLAYRLGLVDAEFTRSLHLVRRIRNSFAHEFSSMTLDGGAHRDRIKELLAPIKDTGSFRFILKKSFDNNHSSSSYFRATVALMSIRLSCLHDITKALTNLKPLTMAGKLSLEELERAPSKAMQAKPRPGETTQNEE